MKTFKNIIVVLLLAVSFIACKNETAPEVVTVAGESTETKTDQVAELDPNATYAKAEFTIEGMTCAMGCAKTIEKKMAKLEGVKSAKVDFDTRLAMVEYDEAKVTPTTLKEIVKKAGDTYSVTDMKTVDSFAENGKKECTMKCSPDCKEKDCAKCAEKTAECKKKCAEKAKTASTDMKECGKDCKMACCADKVKA